MLGTGCALPLAVSAETQSGGRGRRGRFWASPVGGVWVSIGWETARGLQETGAIGMLLALGVVRVVEGVVPELAGRVRIKWPNDVVVDGKKICGVLCERAGGVVIAGVGVNCDFGVDALPVEVRETATTLRDVFGGAVDAAVLMEALVDRVEELIEWFETDGFGEAVRGEIGAVLDMVGEVVRVEIEGERVVEGVLVGIDDGGCALIEMGGVVERVGAGEVVRARRG